LESTSNGKHSRHLDKFSPGFLISEGIREERGSDGGKDFAVRDGKDEEGRVME
jgi:hypothetical protein